MSFEAFPKALEHCCLCPRLVEHREAIAKQQRMRRHAYTGESYWAKPVPGFGDTNASILLLGLAPGAHGSNRTGRMFTGDASGTFLYPALYRAGFASQAQSHGLGDGMILKDLWISAACRCVPPDNKPRPDELRNCQTWFRHDLRGLAKLKLILALGSIAHYSYLAYIKAQGHTIIKKDYPFEHGRLHSFPTALPMLDSYHVSFQNTNTGKLSNDMFDSILKQAKVLAELHYSPHTDLSTLK